MKFGKIIDSDLPIAIGFFNSLEDNVSFHPIMKDLACKFEGEVKVIKMDVIVNKELAKALNIKKTPIIMIYYDGERIAIMNNIEDDEFNKLFIEIKDKAKKLLSS